MDMDLTFPATSTPPAAVAGPLPAAAAACHQLPFPGLAVVARSPPPLSPPPPPAAAAPPPVPSSGAPTLTAVAPPAGAGGDATEEDRMDLLWEDFNEELARDGSCCRAAASGPWPPSDSSDAESEPAAARGCAPVLRPSSRAGAVRHCRRRAGTWALLMRIFRRLFVVEKTVSRRHRAAATARAR